MDDRETELSRFRRQWQAEVTARAAAVQPHSSSSSSSAAPKPKVPAFPPRKLSASACEAPEEDEKDVEGVPGPRERSTSPTATRRTSVSAAVPESALEHYERAVERETQGSLGESLSLYRKAFRMDAKVDTQYREKYYPRPAAGSKDKSKVTPTVPEHHSSSAAAAAPPTKGVSALVASFANLHILPSSQLGDTEPELEPPVVFSPLTTLPSELLLHILRDLALADVASFARCAQVCKALAFVVGTEQSIWRPVCSAAFQRMLWDWGCQVDGSPLTSPSSPSSDVDDDDDGDPPSSEPRVIPTDAAVLPDYSSNWRTMFAARPRIRFNGIYISTCNYTRSGASQGWNTPVHIVTYYRYLRFYPTGTVLSLLSTAEPADVVPAFGRTTTAPAAWVKYVSPGRWRLDPGGRVDVEAEPQGMHRYLFRMQMRVRGTRSAGAGGGGGGGGGRGINRLAWEGFWSWNRLTDDLAEFSLRNDKAFVFSRVASIERESGIV